MWLYWFKQLSTLMFLLRSTVGNSVSTFIFYVSLCRYWLRYFVQNRGWSALIPYYLLRFANIVSCGKLLFIQSIIIVILIEMKNKKMITESSREQKRTLRIAQSPKKVTKLKLSSLLQANKQKQMDQINEVIRQKLQDYPNTASRNKGFNPYEAIYQNDLAYLQEYRQATGRYEQGGINLKWPYYFTAQQQQFPDKE